MASLIFVVVFKSEYILFEIPPGPSFWVAGGTFYELNRGHPKYGSSSSFMLIFT